MLSKHDKSCHKTAQTADTNLIQIFIMNELISTRVNVLDVRNGGYEKVHCKLKVIRNGNRFPDACKKLLNGGTCRSNNFKRLCRCYSLKMTPA